MSLVFYTYSTDMPYEEAPYNDRELYNLGVYSVFIVYNPVDGEAAFFSVEDDEVIPFDNRQMALVLRRYSEWCVTHPEDAKPTPEGNILTFDREAYDSFMRSLG